MGWRLGLNSVLVGVWVEPLNLLVHQNNDNGDVVYMLILPRNSNQNIFSLALSGRILMFLVSLT